MSDNEELLNNDKIKYIRKNESYEHEGIIYYKGEIKKEKEKKYYEIKEEMINLIYQGKEDKFNGYKIISYEENEIIETIYPTINRKLERMSEEELYEYIKEDRMENIKEIILYKNTGDFIEKFEGCNNPIYKKLNEKETYEMWKYDVEERIKKLSYMYKEKTLKKFDEYKSEITCLFS
jgi:hypothetical protein